jgi:hypothetical protein
MKTKIKKSTAIVNNYSIDKCIFVYFSHSEAIDESIPINQWSVDQVCKWLVEIGLGIYCQTFQENEIIGEHLLDLSRDDLKDLGINKVGHLKTLQQKLEQERNK